MKNAGILPVIALATLPLGGCLKTFQGQGGPDVTLTMTQEEIKRKQELAKKLLATNEGRVAEICAQIKQGINGIGKGVGMLDGEVQEACTTIELFAGREVPVNKPTIMSIEEAQKSICSALSRQENTEPVPRGYTTMHTINYSTGKETIYDRDFRLVRGDAGVYYEVQLFSSRYEVIFPGEKEHPRTFEAFITQVKGILAEELKVKSLLTNEIKDKKFFLGTGNWKTIAEMNNEEFVKYFLDILSASKTYEWFGKEGAIGLGDKIIVVRRHPDTNTDKCEN